jgi:inward rectifier potassium channel
MAFKNKINSNSRSDSNSGFGSSASNYGGRFINKDGNPNVLKKGIGFLDSISWYHTMLIIPKWKFLTIIVLFYFFVNSFFAFLYYAIGVEHLNGIVAIDKLEQFGQSFFFSIQTFTTVGYGHISPNGFWTSLVAAIEALIGLLSFAIATGLLYGRFSKPKAHLLFSDNALIAPFLDGKALMMRLTPHKNTNLSEAEAKVTLGMVVEQNGKLENKFFQLDLELNKVNSLTLSWTLVHPINENSPLFDFTKYDFETTNGEIIVFVKVFDDMYSTNVVKRTSYTFKEIVYGAKFDLMFAKSDDNQNTILNIDKLNSFSRIDLE